jgi:hypothetical protein
MVLGRAQQGSGAARWRLPSLLHKVSMPCRIFACSAGRSPYAPEPVLSCGLLKLGERADAERL